MKKKQLFRSKLSFSKEEMKATVKLDHAGVNLLLPNDPKQLAKVRDRLGFFGGSGDANTYFPNLNVQSDVIPKEEDFINVPFRLLSATVVAGGSWRSTDFSKAGVLKKSVSKLEKKPIYFDHDTELTNWLGIVTSTTWSPSFTDSKGNLIPAGIDGNLAIDAKSNPKFARGVLLGAIFSNSVTVDFAWEMSHPFTDINEFDAKVGTIHKDGKMITRLVTEVFDYYETSLVWLGADPYAKKKEENGDLLHPDMGSVVELSKEPEEIRKNYLENKKYSLNACLTQDSTLSLRQQFIQDSKVPEKTPMDKKLLAKLRKLLSLAEDVDITEAHVEALHLLKADTEIVETATLTNLRAKESEVVSLNTKVTELTTKVTSLTDEVTTLKTEKAGLETLAKVGETYTESKKVEIERLYKLSIGAGNEDAAVIALIKDAKTEALDGLLAQYTKGVTQKFKGSCVSCGSQELTFKSSLSEADLTNTAEVTPASISRDTLHKTYSKNKF